MENQKTVELNRDEVLTDFLAKLHHDGKWIEIAQAKPGGSKYTKATYYDRLDLNKLKSSFGLINLSFLPGITPRDGFTLNSKTARCTINADVLEKNIIVWDLDLKDVYPDFLKGAPNDKASVAARVFMDKILPELERLGIRVWIGSHSGNGVHVYIYMATQLRFESPDHYSHFYHHVLDFVEATMFDGRERFDRACANTARLIRVPYTTNYKDAERPIPTRVIYHDPNADGGDFLRRMFDEATADWCAIQEREIAECEARKNKQSSYSNDHRDRLRASLNFKSILAHCAYSKTGSIQNRNGGRFFASSPYCEDKNPSCSFDDGKGVFYCHATQKGGDYFDLIADLENLDVESDFPKVIEIAERITGIAPPAKRRKPKTLASGESPFTEIEVDGKSVSDSTETEVKEPAKKKKPRLKSDVYFKFFNDGGFNFRRDIFSQELMTLQDGRWESAHSMLGVIRSHAIDAKLIKNDVADHMSRYALKKRPELLIDLPEWDKVDRIKVMVDCLPIKNMNSDQACELVKDWAAKAFKRIYDPFCQNRILILKGCQGAGKDTWTNALTHGFGQFAAEVNFEADQIEVERSVSKLGLVRVSEFDKTSRTQVSFLKWLVTTDHTNVRYPYDRAEKIRSARFSFIASCNVEDILRDHTGSRRFIILDLGTERRKENHIERDYPRDQGLQLLAQFKYLAETGYTASKDTEKVLETYLDQHTPEDPKEAVLAFFDARIGGLEVGGQTEFPQSEIIGILKDIKQTFDHWTMNRLLSMLKANGRSKRKNDGTVYFRPTDERDKTPVKPEKQPQFEYRESVSMAEQPKPEGAKVVSMVTRKPLTAQVRALDTEEVDEGRQRMLDSL